MVVRLTLLSFFDTEFFGIGRLVVHACMVGEIGEESTFRCRNGEDLLDLYDFVGLCISCVD